jgi:hypothetical protein
MQGAIFILMIIFIIVLGVIGGIEINLAGGWLVGILGLYDGIR